MLEGSKHLIVTFHESDFELMVLHLLVRIRICAVWGCMHGTPAYMALVCNTSLFMGTNTMGQISAHCSKFLSPT
jgi:hypothetical protein